MFMVEFVNQEGNGTWIDLILKTSPEKMLRRYAIEMCMETFKADGSIKHKVWQVDGDSNQEIDMEVLFDTIYEAVTFAFNNILEFCHTFYEET